MATLNLTKTPIGVPQELQSAFSDVYNALWTLHASQASAADNAPTLVQGTGISIRVEGNTYVISNSGVSRVIPVGAGYELLAPTSDSGVYNLITLLAGDNIQMSLDKEKGLTVSANLEKVYWDSIVDAPATYPPSVHSHALSDVVLYRRGSSSFKTISDYFDSIYNSSLLAGGQITLNADCTISVAAGSCLIRETADNSGHLYVYDFSATNLAAIVAGATKQVVLVQALTTNGDGTVSRNVTVQLADIANNSNILSLATVTNINGKLHFLAVNPSSAGLLNTIITKDRSVSPVAIEASSGFKLTTGVSRTLQVEAGALWASMSRYTHAYRDTAVKAITEVYGAHFGLTLSSWPNANYYNTSTDSLAAITAGKYGCLWIYSSIDTDDWFIAYGTAQFDSATAAAASQAPSYLSAQFTSSSFLLGRLIFLAGADSPFDLETASNFKVTGTAAKFADLVNSYASLVNGKVPESQLPSYVDDVLEFDKFEAFPITGEQGKIYVDCYKNATYRWTGTVYVKIGDGSGGQVLNSTDDLAEGTVNKYYTDARARTALSASGDLAYNPTTGAISYTAPAKEPPIAAGLSTQYWRGDKSWQVLDKTAVGLGKVPNQNNVGLADDASAINLPPEYNLNDISITGFFRVQRPQNSPNAGAADWWYIVSITHGTDWRMQIAHALTGGKQFTYSRRMFNCTWGDWEELLRPSSDITAARVSATIPVNGIGNLLSASMGSNDNFRLLVGGGDNAGFVELATADDGTEPIHVRQYAGVFETLQRTLTLLDEHGNTTVPGFLTAGDGSAGEKRLRLRNTADDCYFYLSDAADVGLYSPNTGIRWITSKDGNFSVLRGSITAGTSLNAMNCYARSPFGGPIFVGTKIGGTYGDGTAVFRAVLDNPNGANSYLFEGFCGGESGTRTHYVRADGAGYFASDVSVGSGATGLRLRSYADGYWGGIYSTAVTPDVFNYSFLTDGAGTIINGPSTGVSLRIANTEYAWLSPTGLNLHGRLYLPWRGTANQTLQIGTDSDFGVNSFEAGIAMPAGTTNLPFGICKGGSPIFTIDSGGSVITGGNITSAGKLVLTEGNYGNYCVSAPGGHGVLISGADLDTVKSSGFYRGQTFTNAPAGNTGWFFILSQSHDSFWVTQTAVSYGSANTANLIYTRTCVNGVWSPWAELITTSNLAAHLGSESGGSGGLLQSRYSEISSPVTAMNGGMEPASLSNTTLLTSITLTPHALGNALRIRCTTINNKSHTGNAELHIFDSSGSFIKSAEVSLQGGYAETISVIAQITASSISPVTIQARARGNNEAITVNGCSLEVEEIGDAGRDVAKVFISGTAYTHSDATWKAVPFNTTRYDTNGLWDSTNNRFVPKRAGYYQFNMRIRCNSVAIMSAAVVKNGLSGWNAGTASTIGSDTNLTANSGTCSLYCNGTTDYVELWLWSNDFREYTTGFFDTWFEIVGPL